MRKRGIKLISIVCGISFFALLFAYLTNSEGTKKIPYTLSVSPLIIDTNDKNASYELIDTLEFSLEQSSPIESYDGIIEGKGVVFSFTETDNTSINFSLNVQSGQDEGTYGGGFTADSAIFIELESNTPYQFLYGLGGNGQPMSRMSSEDYVGEAHGIIKIYKIIK